MPGVSPDPDVAYQQRMYAETGNPIHVWRGIQICCEARPHEFLPAEFPAWIATYLEAGAGTIQQMFYEQRARPDPGLADQLAAGLGFKRAGRGVHDTAFSTWDRELRDQQLAGAILQRRRTQPGVPTTDLIADLADHLQVSERTVWRAWQRWRHRYE